MTIIDLPGWALGLLIGVYALLTYLLGFVVGRRYRSRRYVRRPR
jgi:hypothetical protein